MCAKGRLITIGCLLLLVTHAGGCASQRYVWKNYDGKLYQYYKNANKRDALIEELQKIIQEGEKKNAVPPGIYAEYGYLLYESKQYQEAIDLFRREKARWPESTVLMDKMIANAERRMES